eukprot:1160914-Pelagomonas_calceolata.AAC.6
MGEPRGSCLSQTATGLACLDVKGVGSLFVPQPMALVDNGPHPPPGETGAKFIIREDGRRINLEFMKAGQDKRLELGDKEELLGLALRNALFSSTALQTNLKRCTW